VGRRVPTRPVTLTGSGSAASSPADTLPMALPQSTWRLLATRQKTRSRVSRSAYQACFQRRDQRCRSENTLGKYEFCFNLLLALADRRKVTRISQIDVALLDAFRAERAAGGDDHKPAKPKTVHNDTVTIRQLVNFAFKRGMITEDPLKGFKIKKPRRTPQPCWTRDEVDGILSAARPPHRDPLVFLAETGAPVGEGKWLAWSDVDFDRRIIHIRPKEGCDRNPGTSVSCP